MVDSRVDFALVIGTRELPLVIAGLATVQEVSAVLAEHMVVEQEAERIALDNSEPGFDKLAFDIVPLAVMSVVDIVELPERPQAPVVGRFG